MKRLSSPTGAVLENEPKQGDTDTQVQRPAILVHGGPEGQPITFMSGDGEIHFDAARIKRIVDIHNARMDRLAAEYGGADKIPMGAYEPILDSHENDSNDRVIGRLTGKLKYEVRDIPKVGKNVPCAICHEPGITFLGADTVNRVKDGRIYHLSIGINEEDDTLGETSTVVKPAAPGAMLLKQGKQKTNLKGGITMSEQLKKLKAAHAARMVKLSAMKDTFGTMTTKLTATNELVKLTARKGQVTHRLKALCSAGKMTPAEYKVLLEQDGLTKLSKMDDETLKMALFAFEARQQPVIEPGQRGSSDAVGFGEMAQDLEKKQFKRLRSEVAADFKRLSGKKLIDGEEDKDADKKEMSGPKEEPVNPGKDPHSVPGQAGDEQQLSAHLAKLSHHLEAGDIAGAKECTKALAAHLGKHGMKHMAGEGMGDVKSEDYQAGMQSLQMEVDEVKTQLARMAGMVEELIGAEKQEGEHFEDMGKEHGAVPPAAAPGSVA